MMLASLVGHSMIDIGTQAIAGIGRKTSIAGMNSSLTSGTCRSQGQGNADAIANEEADQNSLRLMPMLMRNSLIA